MSYIVWMLWPSLFFELSLRGHQIFWLLNICFPWQPSKLNNYMCDSSYYSLLWLTGCPLTIRLIIKLKRDLLTSPEYQILNMTCNPIMSGVFAILLWSWNENLQSLHSNKIHINISRFNLIKCSSLCQDFITHHVYSSVYFMTLHYILYSLNTS